MICPQTKAECQYNCDYLMQRQCKPPPPTLAEIEGLVNTFEQQTINCYMHGLGNHAEWKAARATLMAAIRAYGRE